MSYPHGLQLIIKNKYLPSPSTTILKVPNFFSILKYYIINLILLDATDLDDYKEGDSLDMIC
jgi:hypothetical protein